jgi:hypothetical protein
VLTSRDRGDGEPVAFEISMDMVSLPDEAQLICELLNEFFLCHEAPPNIFLAGLSVPGLFSPEGLLQQVSWDRFLYSTISMMK